MEEYIIRYLENQGRSDEYIFDFLKNFKSLNLKERSLFIYETVGKKIYKEYPVDMKTFIHDPYFLGTIYSDIIFKIWDDLLQEIYPAPFCKQYEEILLSCGTRCFGKGTKIMMFDGTSKNVEDIIVGDTIMGDDSTPRKVLSLARGRENMYKVIPNKGGEPFICNESHDLVLKCTANHKRSLKFKKNKIDIISVKEYLKQTKQYKHFMKLYRSPATFNNNKELEVDPYIYGLYLGDGSTKSACLTTIDDEIADVWLKYAKDNNLKVSIYSKKHTKAKTYRILTNCKYSIEERPAISRLITKSSKTGQKRILHEYLTSSRENRLKLLAGIIDTDGYKDKRKNDFISISTKCKDLAGDYAFLARSLGYRATIKERSKKLSYLDKTYVSYEINITGKLSEIPVKLERKKTKVDTLRVDPLKTGFKIEPIGEGDFYGFTLNGNNLFLLDDFMVQKNSGKSTSIIISAAYEIYLLMCMLDPAKTIAGKGSARLVFGLLSKDNSTACSQLGNDISKCLTLSPYFTETIKNKLGFSTLDKTGVEVTDNILLKAGSSISTVTGTDLFFGCLDEANMPSPKISAENLVETRLKMYSFMLDRKQATLSKAPTLSGMMWMTSSPMDEGDVIGERISEVESNGIPHVLIRDNISRWEAREEGTSDTFDFFLGSNTKDPCLLEETEISLSEEEREKIIQIPRTLEYLNYFKTKPYQAIQEVAGRRTVSEASLFNSVAMFSKVFNKPNHIFTKDDLSINIKNMNNIEDYLYDKDYFKHPDKPDCYRYIHLDIASKKDRFGLSSIYSDKILYKSEDGEELWQRKYYVDFCLGISSSGKDAVDILKVLEWIYGLKKQGYPIKMVTTDNHQGELARQIIAKHGIKTEYLSVEDSKEPYYNLKNIILTGVLEGFKNDLLTKELRGLRDYVGTGRKEKIEKSKGFTDDLSDSLAGASYACSLDKFYKKTNEAVKEMIRYQNRLKQDTNKEVKINDLHKLVNNRNINNIISSHRLGNGY